MIKTRVLGDNIKSFMDEKNISIKEIGRQTGLSEDDVLRTIEARKILPSRILVKIAEILETDPMKLFEENKDEKHYSMVDCMNDFSDRENEDKILNIMDAYCNLRDTLPME